MSIVRGVAGHDVEEITDTISGTKTSRAWLGPVDGAGAPRKGRRRRCASSWIGWAAVWATWPG